MKKVVSIILILCIFCGVAACSPKVGEGKKVTLYFANGAMDGVNAESVTVASDLSEQELLQTALVKLLEGPQVAGNQRVIPEGTELLSVKAGKTRATIDFSGNFMNTKTVVEELLCRYTIVRTVSELGIGIESMNILVAGNPLVSKLTGEAVGELTLEKMVASLADDNTSVEEITLYFANEEMYLVPEVREVETKSTDTIETKIVTELCKGPETSDLLSVIPTETKVISVEVKDRICYVNLSKEFSEKLNTVLEEQLKIYAVVNSLTELRGIDKVQILIEGAKVESLNYLMIQDPLERNENVIMK